MDRGTGVRRLHEGSLWWRRSGGQPKYKPPSLDKDNPQPKDIRSRSLLSDNGVAVAIETVGEREGGGSVEVVTNISIASVT